jgi:hypothetical protein
MSEEAKLQALEYASEELHRAAYAIVANLCYAKRKKTKAERRLMNAVGHYFAAILQAHQE